MKGPKRIINRASKYFYIYRYDLFSLALMSLGILYYVSVLFKPGHIVFSDIDFPFYSKDYMDEIYGLWNTRWNTVSMLNIPRLFFIIPLYLLSGIFSWNGHLFIKGFIVELLFLSAFSMYLLTKRLISVYMGRKFNLWKVTALIFGGLFYALNPWIIYRIQHIYLLTGYSLFPLVILYFFKVFDHKFQRQIIDGYSQYSKKIHAKNILDMLILGYLITMSSAAIHYFFYSVLVLGILFILLCIKYFIQYFKHGRLILKNIFKAIFVKLVLLGTMTFGMSFYWLSIYIGGIALDVGASQHNINVIDTYTMFSRHASLDQVVYLLGYWWPMINLGDIPLGFYMGGGVLIIFVIIGAMTSSYKHHIVLFLSILGGLLVLNATGVYYPALSGVFLRLANLPVFGNIFRDPNKMIGLQAIVYSVLLVFGIEVIYRWTENKTYGIFVNGLVFVLLSLSMFFYLAPIKNLYFDRFYQPIEEPVAHQELRDFYLRNEDGGFDEEKEEPYVLYMPVAEHMLRPISHIATPTWNTPSGFDNTKATGDIHIYNSPVKTVFHHEGNDPSIKYYYDLMQLLLDQGRTTHIKKLVQAFGVNQLIYHNEYLDQEIRQEFNEEILDVQSDLERIMQNSIFTIFNVKRNVLDAAFNHRRIFTPYGLLKMNSFMEIEGFDPLESPLVFMTKTESFDPSIIQSDDIIEYQYLNDLVLPSVEPEYKLYPFEYVHEVNPYLKWSKTYTTFVDWAWFQKKMDIIHPSFDWDQDRGMVLTFASEAFDVKPHEKKNIEGEIVYDFDSLLRADNFFVPDNPDLFEVISNPYNAQENVGILQGVVQQGDPSFIWQVAKSPILTAEEKMPYQFKILLSGRGANKLHMKARFYDKNRKEIGIQYIVGPDEFTNFDTVDFTGEVVSPKDTAFIRIDLLTYQRPENKIYWWIHDVEIKKFPRYTKPNRIEMSKAVEGGQYKVFIRHFKSQSGGEFEVEIGGASHLIDSKTSQLSGFQWTEVEDVVLESGELPVTITNISGFNAIQNVVIVPSDIYDKKVQVWKRVLGEHDQMLMLETEIDFEKDGNIQSRRLYPELSYGTGIAISKGTLNSEFEVAAPGHYDVKPEIYFKNKTDGFVEFQILDDNNELVYSNTIKNRSILDKKETVTVEFDPLGQVYPYSIIEKQRPMGFTGGEVFEDIPLKAGRYSINMVIDSENENLASLETFHAFDPNSIVTESVRRDQAISDCSTCERITSEMMKHSLLGENDLNITYDATCSCDWYISSSEPIEVDELEELLITFEARSDAIVKRHSKLIFLDAYDQVLDTSFIFEVEEPEKVKWNTYEQLVKVPTGAKKVLFQFWARGHKTRSGQLELRNFKLESYEDFIVSDYVFIRSSNLDFTEKDMNPNIVKNSTSEMVFNHEVTGAVNNRTVWNSFMSPHKIWKVNGEQSQLALNGVTMGFTQSGGELNGKMVLADIYKFGLFLHGLTIILSLGLYFKVKNKNL